MLAGTSQWYCFPQNLVADQVAQGAANYNLDAPSKQFFQVGGQATWEPRSCLAGNINQEVNIAFGRIFASRYRAENPDIPSAVASCQPQDFIAMFSDWIATVHIIHSIAGTILEWISMSVISNGQAR